MGLGGIHPGKIYGILWEDMGTYGKMRMIYNEPSTFFGAPNFQTFWLFYPRGTGAFDPWEASDGPTNDRGTIILSQSQLG